MSVNKFYHHVNDITQSDQLSYYYIPLQFYGQSNELTPFFKLLADHFQYIFPYREATVKHVFIKDVSKIDIIVNKKIVVVGPGFVFKQGDKIWFKKKNIKGPNLLFVEFILQLPFLS